MMGEHHALRVKGQQLAKAQNISAQMPTHDPFKSAVADQQTALGSAAKGHAFDSTYIANEVGIHQAVIAWAGTAETLAQNQVLKDLIKAAGPVLQKHLDRAQAIQGAPLDGPRREGDDARAFGRRSVVADRRPPRHRQLRFPQDLSLTTQFDLHARRRAAVERGRDGRAASDRRIL